jgi:hypothetical protein
VNPARQKWDDLSPARKRLLIAVGVFDAGMRAWALLDLKNRPADEVNGPKPAWALAITVVNSAGVVPTVYLLLGRRRPQG